MTAVQRRSVQSLIAGHRTCRAHQLLGGNRREAIAHEGCSLLDDVITLDWTTQIKGGSDRPLIVALRSSHTSLLLWLSAFQKARLG